MRLLLADDQELVRDTIAAFLQTAPDIVVETASDFNEGMALVQKNAVYDVVLLDYMMPGMNGLDGLAKMIKALPGKAVAILSGSAPRHIAEQALEMGAKGFLPKTMSTKSLIAAVRFMAAGEIYAPILMNAANAGSEVQGPNGVSLTPRETDVLRRLCEGKANKEIARDLDLQEVTVKLHVKSLYRKIDARNRTHAAMIAKECGLV